MRRLTLAVVAILIATEPWPAAADAVPAYRVVREGMSGFGRTVDVAVDGPLDQSEIGRLVSALGAKTAAGRQTLVNVYLPGMKVGDAPYASGTHAASIAVNLRTTEGATRAAGHGEPAPGGSDVPSWLRRQWDMTWPEAAGRLTISRTGQRYRAEWVKPSGLRLVEELAAAPSLRGLRLDALSPTSRSFYVIRPDDTLEVHGPAGLEAKGAFLADPGVTPAGQGAGQRPPPPRRPDQTTEVSATAISVIEPWPRTAGSRLALARTVLTDTPPTVVAKESAPAPAPRAPAASAASRSSQSAAAQRRQSNPQAEQARIWQSLAKYLQPRD